MQIEIIDPDPEVDIDLMKKSVELVIGGEDKTSDYINVIFLGRKSLRKLKKEYFDLDVDTDVIVFNLNEPDEQLEGEIYLSLQQIKLNALRYGSDARNELQRVLIHGCLHLCGYEDKTSGQKAQMTLLEDRYLLKLEI